MACSVQPVILLFPAIGTVAGRRRLARVQAPIPTHPQMDDPTLQSFQGRLGLGHPTACHVHRHLHAIRSSLPAQ